MTFAHATDNPVDATAAPATVVRAGFGCGGAAFADEEAAAAGCTRFVFVTSPEKGAIMSHFGDAPHYQEMLEARGKTRELALLKAGLPKNAEIFETYQDAPLGLGHAIWCAREATGDKPFAVILPDDMVQHQTGCLAQMAAHYETVGGNLVAVENVPSEETYRYGVLNPGAETDDLVEVKGLVEKPAPEDAPSTLAIIGRYILDAKIMDTLSAFKKGAGGEIQITDAMAELIGHVPMHGFRFAGTRYDCGNRDGFLEANLAFALAQGGDELKQRLRQLLD